MRTTRTGARHVGCALIALALIASVGMSASAQAGAGPNRVQIREDAGGFRLFVDGEPFEVKGMVWSYTPIGENYTYDLWSQPDDFIRDVIDRDAEMMKAIGVNAIRVFSDVPPEWITYFYRQHGIYTIVNYLFGRYGMTVRGIWYPQTDYSDYYTRLAIVEEALEMVELYKDVPGVLMFLFGNENNYGLEWDSGQIENLPVGQRSEVRAGYLYSLFEEAISVGRTIAPNHPFGLVNGDIQYINLIQQLVPSLQILGVNTYRGGEAYDLFFQSIERLGVPFVYTELGADAFNVLTGQEDQYHQADYIHRQWREIYQQGYGKGGYQNALGGFVFQWMDEWWKHGQEDRLDVHDTVGTWTNGGYPHDASTGIHNMNEEWFGVVAQSPRKLDGINRRIPRASYYLLGDAWELSLYDSTLEEVNDHFAAIGPENYVARGDTNTLQETLALRPVTFDGFSARVAGSMVADDEDWAGDPRTDGTFFAAQELDLTLGIRPFDTLTGHVELRLWNNPWVDRLPNAAEPTYLQYEDDTASDDFDTTAVNAAIYAGEFTFRQRLWDLHGYYRTGKADWYLHGDPFYLMPEAWDRYSMDRDGSNAPFGLELEGKESLEGLWIAAGPELYWGALPQVAVNYQREFIGDRVAGHAAFMYREAFAGGDDAFPGTEPGRKVSVSGGIDATPYVGVDLALLHSGYEKVGETYNRAINVGGGDGVGGSDWDVEQTEIGIADTFAVKATLTTDILRYTHLWARYTYAGLVADAEPMIPRSGFQVADPGTGNRSQIDLGGRFIFWDFVAEGEVRYRAPLEGPMVAVGGNTLRSPLTDPFAVYWNRETLQGELILTWDTEGSSYFHNWDNVDRETAPLAASLGLLYTVRAGATDRTVFKDAAGTWLSFASGLEEATGLWQLTSRFVANPAAGLRLIGGAHIGTGQSTGESDDLVNYVGASLGARWRQLIFDGSVDLSSWGPHTWQRQFNITYPVQWTGELAWAFDQARFLDREGRIGVRTEGRTYGEDSADDDPSDGFDTVTTVYMEIGF